MKSLLAVLILAAAFVVGACDSTTATAAPTNNAVPTEALPSDDAVPASPETSPEAVPSEAAPSAS